METWLARSLHRATLRAARTLERRGILARCLLSGEPGEDRYWWPDQPLRVRAPRPPSPATLVSIEKALDASERLRPTEPRVKVGRFVVCGDLELLRSRGGLLVAHPLHPYFAMSPVMLVSAGGDVVALNQPTGRRFGAILPLLPGQHANALLDCAHAPVFSARIRQTRRQTSELTVLTTSEVLSCTRDLLRVGANGETCVLREVLDLCELGEAIRGGRCTLEDCKFLLGRPEPMSDMLEEEINNRIWLPIVPLRATLLGAYRVNGRSLLLDGVGEEDYEICGRSREEFPREFWSETVCSVQSSPGFQMLARYPL
eukprot:TRINITY_DN40341_c0_g1_i1.p1 TRINITY_DN40341_c0_g1~~TRINITY_DN40341_c0_g1_i1.p1  ORF type:complete len:331 (+),score=46.39 TRINITY_DN40341_c0_g1_i1:54-995(+)